MFLIEIQQKIANLKDHSIFIENLKSKYIGPTTYSIY